MSYSSAIFRWMNLLQRFNAYNFTSSKSSKNHFQWKPPAQSLRIIFCCLKLFLCKSSGTVVQTLLPSQQKTHSRLSCDSHCRPLTSQPSWLIRSQWGRNWEMWVPRGQHYNGILLALRLFNDPFSVSFPIAPGFFLMLVGFNGRAFSVPLKWVKILFMFLSAPV